MILFFPANAVAKKLLFQVGLLEIDGTLYKIEWRIVLRFCHMVVELQENTRWQEACVMNAVE